MTDNDYALSNAVDALNSLLSPYGQTHANRTFVDLEVLINENIAKFMQHTTTKMICKGLLENHYGNDVLEPDELPDVFFVIEDESGRPYFHLAKNQGGYVLWWTCSHPFCAIAEEKALKSFVKKLYNRGMDDVADIICEKFKLEIKKVEG